MKIWISHPRPSLLSFVIVLVILSILSSCLRKDGFPKRSNIQPNLPRPSQKDPVGAKVHVVTGLENLLQNHVEKLQGRKIGIVTNQTGVDRNGTPIWELIGKLEHVDFVALLSPEHGLHGEKAAGERVQYRGQDTMPHIYSLYGDTRKPTPQMLAGVDLLIYDIQDIGARFYTYITTLGFLLEAAGEENIPVMILDRPNPVTGTRIAGPTLDMKYRSFVGYYPMPAQYGLTCGELAKMIIGEKWITSKPMLEVIPLIGWHREDWYDETGLPWINPSPNIPDLNTAIVYPGMVFLEATNVSEGRGTEHPFLWIGAPWLDGEHFAVEMNELKLPGVIFTPIEFTPRTLPGIANSPKYEGELCFGIELQFVERSIFQSVRTGISILLFLNSRYPDKFEIDENRLNRLAGTQLVYQAVREGWSIERIAEVFSHDLKKFDSQRQKYLLY